jgi:hypothetical protein
MRPLIICLVVALAACGDGAATSTTEGPLDPSTTTIDFDPADLVAYESPTYGFAIAYPSDWDVAEVTAENLIGFTSPVGTSNLTPNFNITVTEVSPDLPPVAYYQGEIERVTTSLENAEIIEVADVNVDGVVGRGLTLVTRQSGVDIGISRIIVINGTRAYELSFFAEATELQRLAPLVASIFQSLRFLD